MAEGSKQKEEDTTGFGIVSSKLGAGPKGLGDPEDKTLRVVEKDILVPKLMKELANERCAADVKAFSECGKQNGLLVSFTCRKENRAMQSCLLQWYKKKAFVDECTVEYLRRRSEYRATGISHKQKRKESATF